MTTERPPPLLHPFESITDLSMWEIGTHPAYWKFFSASCGQSPGLLSRVSRSLKSINIYWWSRCHSWTGTWSADVYWSRETLGDSAPSPSEKLTGLLQWQGTATWGIRSCMGPASGLYRPCWRTWDLHKGPWWRIMMSWHACWTVLPCEAHLDLWGRAAVMRGLGKPTLGLDFIQTQPPDCWVTQACPLTSLAITFIPYIKWDYIFSCWTHSDHIAICCLFGQRSPQISLGGCSGSDDSLLSSRPPAQYWACPRHSINEWMGSGGFLQPLHSLPTPPHCPYAGLSLFQRDLGPSPLWFPRTAGSIPSCPRPAFHSTPDMVQLSFSALDHFATQGGSKGVG